jgi:hypothetical protein
MREPEEVDFETEMYAVSGAWAQLRFGTVVSEMREALEELRHIADNELIELLEARIAEVVGERTAAA